MEETLGKRIMANRKRIGLTQDRLAELLGVTAQAVSKWENNQSCPDITILPRLAEIFDITTDELLGREIPQKEFVPDQISTAPDVSKEPASGFEWHWDSGRRDALTLAVLVILVGILTLSSRLLDWDVSFWSILWPSAILLLGIRCLIQEFSFFSVSCTLLGGYFLMDNLNVIQLDITGELVFPILILVFGISLLVDALKKPKHARWSFHHNSSDKKTKSHYSVNEEHFTCSLSFGESKRQVVMPRLASGDVTCSFGELILDLSGCDEFADKCSITANCSFGELELQVPRSIRVELDSSTSFASVDVHGHADQEPKGTIQLEAKASFGEIIIRYL